MKIREEEFKTKDALKKKIQTILYDYLEKEPLNESDFNFMLAVLNRHPSKEIKIGAGVKSIFVKTNPIYKNKGFYILRHDLTTTDFSFMQCLTRKTNVTKFKTACRLAIANDIVAFKLKNITNSNKCPVTGEYLTIKNSHVDHEHPQFEQIIRDFIKTNNINIDEISLSGSVDGEIGQRIKDKDIETKFIKFHNNIAKLRIISAKANLQRKKVKVKNA